MFIVYRVLRVISYFYNGFGYKYAAAILISRAFLFICGIVQLLLQCVVFSGYLSKMSSENIHILLADDDKDDCLFFKEALDELPLTTQLTTVRDGEQLMHLLQKKTDGLPHMLFLDLNMPRKNGVTCLVEIKSDKKLTHLPVIIFSTSFDQSVADLLYKNGAQYYICKPANFSNFKDVIYRAIKLCTEKNLSQPPKEDFLLNSLKAIRL